MKGHECERRVQKTHCFRIYCLAYCLKQFNQLKKCIQEDKKKSNCSERDIYHNYYQNKITVFIINNADKSISSFIDYLHLDSWKAEFEHCNLIYVES